jgi:hypothetical protein
MLQHQSLAFTCEVDGMIADDVARSQHREANFADFALSRATGSDRRLIERLTAPFGRSPTQGQGRP